MDGFHNNGDGRESTDVVDRGATGAPVPTVALSGRLKVWIDQDLCTGDGICTDHAPDIFTILEDGIAYCRDGDVILNDPGGADSLAVVPPAREATVIAAAAECPGECIFIEFEEFGQLEA